MSDNDIRAFLDRLVVKKIIRQEDLKEIDVTVLVTYSHSPIYHMISTSTAVYTELPFVIGKSYLTGEALEDAPMEQLVQGMIDCVFVYQNDYYFVDFKTDRFVERKGQTKAEVAVQLKERYAVQMHYYKKAIEEMVGQPVKGYLYFFDYQEVEV